MTSDELEKRTDFDRRRLLGWTALGAAGATMPAWLAACFRAEGEPGDPLGGAGVDRVDDALRAARRDGKPLLAIVIPRDDDAKYERGEAFGALLTHGPTRALADLALCRVTCATLAELDEHVPTVGVGGPAEPWAVLVETAGRAWVAKPLHAELPAKAIYSGYGSREEMSESVERRVDALAAVLSGAIAGERDLLAHRARTARAKLAAAEIAAIETHAEAPEQLEGALVERGAALLRLAAEDTNPARILAVLARATERRLVEGTPDGARWATTAGCGIDVDGDDESCGVACGMGFVPEISQRFLWFFATS